MALSIFFSPPFRRPSSALYNYLSQQPSDSYQDVWMKQQLLRLQESEYLVHLTGAGPQDQFSAWADWPEQTHRWVPLVPFLKSHFGTRPGFYFLSFQTCVVLLAATRPAKITTI